MSRHDEDGAVEDALTRRRALAGLTAGAVFGLAGCSGGDSTATDADGDGESAPQETTDGSTGGDEMTTSSEMSGMETESGTSPGSSGEGKNLTVSVGGSQITGYDSLVVSVDSLTFRTGDDSPNHTIQADATVDLAQRDAQNAKTVIDGATVPYGTYDEIALSVTVQNQSDVTGGDLTSNLSPMGDEPIEVTESPFDATLNLFISDQFGELEISGYSAQGL